MAQSRFRREANGTQTSPALAGAGVGGSFAAYDDPMSRVFGLDAQTTRLSAWVGYVLGAIALMLALAVGARAVEVYEALHAAPEPPPSAPQEIELVKDEPTPPPPPEPEAKPDPTAPEPPAPPPRAAPREAPAPAPAQAGKVLTQAPDPNEPIDLTGNTIVSGNADAYAGGVTASNGTGRSAVRGVTSPMGAPSDPGKSPAPSGPDRSRSASIAGGDWGLLPFPPEADSDQINDASVVLRIEVHADGSVGAVRVVSDPGHGFGRMARLIAASKRYQPAQDRSGAPIASSFSVRVNFSR